MESAQYCDMPNSSAFDSSDHQIHRLTKEHGLYARRLDTLRAKQVLSDPEQTEEIRLKKLKLRLKDEMERLRARGGGEQGRSA